MAERRMFAKTIIDSDAFLDMPLSTQALYFHLSMRADDEGFINNPKKIQRMIGATEDDIKLLIAKNFIIPFESGIVVIKHWRIHNYIRGDRLIPTKYKEERELLEVKDNGAYTINSEIKELEKLDATDARKIAYKNSSLPYSFTYKIKRAFEGCICPVCGKKMTSAYKNALPTIQHNTPISKGGLHEIDNISVICESCNTSIQDNETDSLNNDDVVTIWDKITSLEAQKIKWFDTPKMLWQTLDGQVTDNCPSNDSIGKDRLGKVRLGKDSIGEVSIELGKVSLGKDIKEKVYPTDTPKRKPQPIKHKHGQFGHVRLTDRDLELLNKNHGEEETQAAIDYLDSYIEEKGYKTQNHKMTLERWVFDAVKKNGHGNNKTSGNIQPLDPTEYLLRQIREEEEHEQARSNQSGNSDYGGISGAF